MFLLGLLNLLLPFSSLPLLFHPILPLPLPLLPPFILFLPPLQLPKIILG